jgi:putative membrane protein insertion efficiency factor
VTTRASSERRSWWRSRRAGVLALTGAIVAWATLQTSAAERATLGAIGFYRAHGSTVARHLGAQCRFQPTCSRYAELAVQKYGVVRGLAKTGARLVRCNPLLSQRGEVDYP